MMTCDSRILSLKNNKPRYYVPSQLIFLDVLFVDGAIAPTS